MHEQFTERARKFVQLTNQEARRFNHEYIETKHILPGLIKEGSGVTLAKTARASHNASERSAASEQPVVEPEDVRLAFNTDSD